MLRQVRDFFIDFGESVGVGKILNDRMPKENVPDAQCWFEVIDGPWKGKLIMCKRNQFALRERMHWRMQDNGNMAIVEEVPFPDRTCMNCDKTQSGSVIGPLKFKVCSECRSATYCSKECHQAHWKVHKPVCRSLKLLRPLNADEQAGRYHS